MKIFDFLIRKPIIADQINIDGGILEVIKYLGRKEVSNIFDVGAFHGRYALASSKVFENAKIHCFEPSPRAFQVLQRNLVGDRFSLHNSAVSDITGTTKFYLNENHETNSLLLSTQTNSVVDHLTKYRSEISVDAITLQQHCRDRNIDSIDLLKVDVQGATMNVIEGCSELLQKGKIRLIQCEVEFLEIYKNQKLFHHVATYLEKNDFSLYSLYNLHFDVNERLSWADALFYKPNENDD